MQALAFLLILLPMLVVVPCVLPPRLRMERRARALLAAHPDAERTSVYLAFRSSWAAGKRREMDVRIAAMAQSGWTFLRAREANPLRTMRSWGGGVTLQFLRSGRRP